MNINIKFDNNMGELKMAKQKYTQEQLRSMKAKQESYSKSRSSHRCNCEYCRVNKK